MGIEVMKSEHYDFHPSRVSPLPGLMGVSIGPRLFRHGDGGDFSAFTATEKKPIFTRSINLL